MTTETGFGFTEEHPNSRDHFSSMESGFEADSEQDSNTQGTNSSQTPAWYLTCSTSPFRVPTSVTSLSGKESEPSTVCLSSLQPQTPPPVVSPETVPNPQQGRKLRMFVPEQTNLPKAMVVSPSFSSSTSSQTTASSNHEWSDQPMSSYPRYHIQQKPQLRPHCYPSDVQQYLSSVQSRASGIRQGSREPLIWDNRPAKLTREMTTEKELAMEHTLQSCQRPQFVMSDQGLTRTHAPSPPPQSPISPLTFTGRPPLLKQSSGPSFFTQRKQRKSVGSERYVSDDSNYGSGVDTPECFHAHSKVCEF